MSLVGGAPFRRRYIPQRHDCAPHMAFSGEPTPNRCWCDVCGNQWLLVFDEPDEEGKTRCRGWVPLDPADPRALA